MDAPGEKLLCQMWVTLTEKGIGSLLKPWQTRRESRANVDGRRHELLMLAQAEADVADVRAGRKRYSTDGSLISLSHDVQDKLDIRLIEKRIEPTLSVASDFFFNRDRAERIQEEINLSKSIIYAEVKLAEDNQAPPMEEVEDDWLRSWRDYACKTSNEDIQKLWGSILAGEFKSPGTFSLRTLEFLKGLSKKEAELIQLIAPFAFYSRVIWRNIQLLEDEGVPYKQLLKLQELGLLQGVETDATSIIFKSSSTEKFVKTFTLHGKVVLAKGPNPNTNVELKAMTLTSIGQEVLRLGHHLPNLNYFTQFYKNISSMGYGVEFGNYIDHPNDHIELLNMQDYPNQNG